MNNRRGDEPIADAEVLRDVAKLRKCQRFIGSKGYLVCDRCGSMWSPLLDEIGWLPLSCPDRKNGQEQGQ